jgi:hypothetical protein
MVMLMIGTHAQPLTVDPETIIPLPDRLEMETPAADAPPEIARFQARGSGLGMTTSGRSWWLSA